MAHAQQKIFCLSIKQKLPEYFKIKFVLDIGSLDINGNNHAARDDRRGQPRSRRWPYGAAACTS